MKRTDRYRFTVRLLGGKIHPEDAKAVETLRKNVKLLNEKTGGSRYVKLQGRLGSNNPNAWKYRLGGLYRNLHQTIRLEDAATADVYVYIR